MAPKEARLKPVVSSVDPQYSVYFRALPLTNSAGYFSLFLRNFSSTAPGTSMPSPLAKNWLVTCEQYMGRVGGDWNRCRLPRTPCVHESMPTSGRPPNRARATRVGDSLRLSTLRSCLRRPGGAR